MRLCEATIPDVPSPVGWTGVAYSLGHSAACASIALRSFSSASGRGMVRIQVIKSHSFESVRSTEDEHIDRCTEGDDGYPERGLQGVVPCEQHQQQRHQCEKQQRRDRISPGPMCRCGRPAADPEEPRHREADEQHGDEDEVRDDLIEGAEGYVN